MQDIRHKIKKTLLTLSLLPTLLWGQNPVSPMGVYVADPSARVVDGRVYVYGSLDEGTHHYCSRRYHMLSTEDLRNWTLHENIFSWTDILYAPDMWRADSCYLYFDVPSGKEYVAASETPTGPFTNVTQINGPKQIDPNIFVDEGQIFYYWGQFSAKGAKMNPDFRTLDDTSITDSLVTEKDHFFHEGSFVFKRGDYYYYTYADISRRHRPTCLGYAMSRSPLGPYKYMGVIIDNDGCDPETWNNHGSIVRVGEKYYVLYHRSTHGSRMMRKACIEPITFNADGTINEVEMTTQGTAGPLDASLRIDGARACKMRGHVRIRLQENSTTREELGAICAGDSAVWKYLDFGRGKQHVALRMKAASDGVVCLHADTPDGPELARVRFERGDWAVRTAQCKHTEGVHALWMTFEAAEGQNSSSTQGTATDELMSLDWFTFYGDGRK